MCCFQSKKKLLESNLKKLQVASGTSIKICVLLMTVSCIPYLFAVSLANSNQASHITLKTLFYSRLSSPPVIMIKLQLNFTVFKIIFVFAGLMLCPASFGLTHYASCLSNAYTTLYTCILAGKPIWFHFHLFVFGLLFTPPTPSSPFTCKLLLILSLQTVQEKCSPSALEISCHRVAQKTIFLYSLSDVEWAASFCWLPLSVKSLVSSSAVCGTQRWSIILKTSLISFTSTYCFSCRSSCSESF